MTISHIHRATLQTWLSTGTPGQSEEFALLDLRDEESFAKGQPLFATNLPLRRFRDEVERFVPRKDVRTVLIDEGDGSSETAANILDDLGYTDIAILIGGIPAWLADSPNGLPTFDIAGNIFTVAVADQRKTPAISAEELQILRQTNSDLVILDTRTPEEYARFHIPGSRNLPGGELLLRFQDFVPSPDTLVVVTCAWLARAITGAQTLISAKVPNKVVYLIEGTRAWEGIGNSLESGAGEPFEGYSEEAAAFAREHAPFLIKEAGISLISQAEAQAWLAEEQRTTYVLDVRLPAEYEKGHLQGSISSPGGQLLAVSHRTVAVRGARIILVDDSQDKIRAVTSAFWLRQRGWDARVYSGELTDSIIKADAQQKELA